MLWRATANLEKCNQAAGLLRRLQILPLAPASPFPRRLVFCLGDVMGVSRRFSVVVQFLPGFLSGLLPALYFSLASEGNPYCLLSPRSNLKSLLCARTWSQLEVVSTDLAFPCHAILFTFPGMPFRTALGSP